MIVPRWEWRCFGDDLRDLESTFGSPERVQSSDEIYLVSPAGTDAVKVRDELMDVKHLLRTDAEGLEQWVPVMKAPFPLSAADVGAVLSALQVALPMPPSRKAYALRELLDEVVGQAPEVSAVEVHKRRQRYVIGDCWAELTAVRTRQASTHTIAIEAEDPTRVTATVRQLGLASRPNTSFPRGLRTLLALGNVRVAVVDVGTNSVKFHIGERAADGGWTKVVDRATTTRLGDGLRETGRLSPEPMRRTVEAIAVMAEEAAQHAVSAIAAVGTAGLRIAPNSSDLVDAVRARSGVTIEIISGEQEGHLAYLAATAGLGQAPGTRVVFDTGGGSSQFTFGLGDRVEERFSVEVGAVRYTERYHLDAVVSEEVLTEALAALDTDLGRLDGRPTPDVLIAMGGAVTNLAAVKHRLAEYDSEIVQGTVLDLAEIDRQIELYRSLDAADRRTILGLQPQRADIILAGSCIVRTVLHKLGRDSLTVSDRGLRHGVLEDRFGGRSMMVPDTPQETG